MKPSRLIPLSPAVALAATREAWLQEFLAQARHHFTSQGYPLPASIRVGIGWTSKGSRAKAIGECYSTVCSADGTYEIIISPALADGPRVADVLTHELLHAAVGLEHGHKAPFRKGMAALGLEGKATATVAGVAWHAWADPILAELGPYPHATLDGALSSGPKKQGTRMLKAACPACGYAVRLTRKWADLGLPDCPLDGARLECDAIDAGDEGESEEVRQAA